MTIGLDDDVCPVPLELLGALYRADEVALDSILEGIAETTRARLAVYLYGRSHTHELGLRIAAACDGSTLRRAAGLNGNVLFEQSRQPYAQPGYNADRAHHRPKISLGGSRATVVSAVV